MRVRVPVKFFLSFIFCFRKEAGNFSRFTCLQKKTCFDVLCTCKATSLSKKTRLVWRYSDDAGAIIENVYKFCMEENKSGMKLSLNRAWDRTAAVTDVSRSTAQKSVEETKKAQYEQQQPKQPPSSTSKVSLDDFDKCVVRRTIASMYSLKKVLPTLDNIRTELKQSIGYTGSKGRLRKDLLHTCTKSANTSCGVNQKVLMERQAVVLSRTRYLRMVRELREAGFTDETYVHTSHAVPKCWQDSTTGLKKPFSKGNLRIVELCDPWVCTITTI